jgi:hypothetical protein
MRFTKLPYFSEAFAGRNPNNCEEKTSSGGKLLVQPGYDFVLEYMNQLCTLSIDVNCYKSYLRKNVLTTALHSRHRFTKAPAVNPAETMLTRMLQKLGAREKQPLHGLRWIHELLLQYLETIFNLNTRHQVDGGCLR